MNHASSATILVGVGYLCGAVYSVVNLHDHAAAADCLLKGIGALGVGFGLRATHADVQEVKATVEATPAPTPVPRKPLV